MHKTSTTAAPMGCTQRVPIPVCTAWKDWNFIYGVKVSYKLNFAILLFRPDALPMSSQRVALSFLETFVSLATVTIRFFNNQKYYQTLY